MKRMLFAVVLLSCLAVLAVPSQAKELPKQSMKMYQIALIKHGPNWKSQGTDEGMDVRMRVIDGVRKAAATGLIISAGLVNDETNVEFIFILDLETKTEAYNLLMNAELVKNGFYTPEIYSYFGPEGLAVKR